MASLSALSSEAWQSSEDTSSQKQREEGKAPRRRCSHAVIVASCSLEHGHGSPGSEPTNERGEKNRREEERTRERRREKTRDERKTTRGRRAKREKRRNRKLLLPYAKYIVWVEPYSPYVVKDFVLVL